MAAPYQGNYTGSQASSCRDNLSTGAISGLFPVSLDVTSQGYLCILLQAVSATELPSHARLTEFTVQLERKLENSFLFACMPVFSVLSNLSQVYGEMCGLLSYGFYFPEKTLLFPEDVHKCELAFPVLLFQIVWIHYVLMMPEILYTII